jgi:hypothetical protein
MTTQRIRVGNGCGFWGDQPDAPVLLVQHGHLDFLTLEYLAELTMSILAQQRQRDATLGYATDFLEVLERLVPLWHEQPQLRIITNAGGLKSAWLCETSRGNYQPPGLTQTYRRGTGR